MFVFQTSDAEPTQRYEHSLNTDSLQLEKANISMSKAEPREGNAEPTEGDAKLTQRDAVPTEGDTKPTEGDTKPTQRDSELTKGDAEPTQRDEHPEEAGDSEAAQGQPEPVKKEFNLETADANELMDEIIRVTHVNYEFMKQRVANPGPIGPNGENMAAEILKKYEEKDALLDLYFDRLKVLLQENTPGLTELQIQERQLAATVKLNNGMILF